MSGASARDGRRRRVLQDEILSASREMPAYRDDEPPTDGEGRRYAFVDHSVASALAKRHFPSRVIVPVGMALASLVAAVGLVALDQCVGPVANLEGSHTGRVLHMSAAGSVAKWLATFAMLATGLGCTMILSVRRRRVDDYRGKYKLWRGAAALAVVVSLSVATGLHHVFAEIMTRLTGTGLFAGGAGWWMLAGGAALAWVATRVMLDLRESRLSVAMFSAALLALGVSFVGSLGFPTSDTVRAGLDGVALVGYCLVPVALVCYMRFLRHDVAAGVATRLRVTKPVEVPAVESTPRTVKTQELKIAESTEATSPRKRDKPRVAAAKESVDSRWTDGSDVSDDEYDDEFGLQGRKFNKSDRKRQRKEKEARRAA